MKPVTFWQRVGRGVRDRSFIIGSILVVLLLLAAVLGPMLAPRNPYTRDRIQTIDGRMQRAPFPPGRYYPLGTNTEGTDLLSLLLHGARQTLVIAFVAMTIRLLLGLVLGTVCGWWPGGPFDRAVTAVTELLASIPTLVLAMLLIYAIGIRRGQISFIIALSAIGWGEVTQIVRGHVLGIRSKLYISAARAVGLSSPEILSRHVLPNLLSTLLALAALEMAGLLLLLGELGFVGIFIGGGGVYVDDARGIIHHYDVPDWGAMLGSSWRFLRSQPWIPLVPALSFLVAILGFNLFGYGLQRFVEKGRFHPSGWSVLRFLAVVGVLLFGARTLLANTGPEAQYVAMARQFDVQRAWNDILYLTQPELEGRPTGPGAGYQAAGYIAYHFEQAGLTPLTNGTYFQPYTASPVEVVAPPVLEVLGADGEAILRLEDEVSLNPAVPFRTHLAEHEEYEAYDYEESVPPSYVENLAPGDLEEDEVSFEENDTYSGLPAPFASDLEFADLEEEDVLSGRLVASGLPALFASDREPQDVLSVGRLVASGREGVRRAEGERAWLIEGEGVWQAEGEGVWHAEGEGGWYADGEGGWHAEGEGGWHAEGEGAWHAEGEGVWHADGEGAWHAEGEGVWHAEGEGVWHAEGEGVWYAEGERGEHVEGDGIGHAEGDGVSRTAMGAWETAGEGIWQSELVVVGDVTSGPRTGLILLLDPTDEYADTQWMWSNPAVAIIRLVPDDEIRDDDLPFANIRSQLPRYPHLLISESGARRLLALANLDLDQLQADRRAGQSIVLHTGLQVRVTARLAYDSAPAVNVVGYFPAADMTTQGERILVAASYTGPLVPEGTVYPGADEDASAVAVMLEVARLWHDIGFEPKRTVIFAALDSRGGPYLVNHPIFPMRATDTWTMVMIHGIGAGDRRLARLPVLGDSLALTFDRSARLMGIHTTELGQWRFPFEGSTISEAWQMQHAYRGLAVTRPGDERSGTPTDTPDHLDPQLLAEAGWTLAHYLMVLSSR